MNIVVNVRGHEFECIEIHYLPIYKLEKDYE